MSEKEPRFMDGKTFNDITPSDLIKEYVNNTKDLKSLDDISEVYDTLDRSLFIGDVTSEVGDAIEHIIRLYNIADANIPVEERVPIKIFINSDGGSVISALEIIDSIILSKTPIYTINVGIAASSGLDIFMVGHKRFCYPHATFLFHEGMTNSGYLDAGKFRNYSTWYDSLLKKMQGLVLTYTKMTPELYKEKQNDDFWFFADEAIELGFCDEILEEFI